MPAECAPQTACVPGSEIIPGQGRNATRDSFRRPFRNPHHSASGGDELLPLRL
jgi:predicted ATPase with chaperone activity